MARHDIFPAVPSEGNTGSPSPLLNLVPHTRDVHMYWINEQELDELFSHWKSPELVFFSITITLAVSFSVTLTTVNLDDRGHASFLALAVSCALLSAFFLVRAAQVARGITKRREVFKNRDAASLERVA